MSILIKGMEMPSSCGSCPLIGEDTRPLRCSLTEEIIGGCAERNCWDGRGEHCPLVPVPPHGRLIDADKAIENIMIRQYALKDRTGNVDSGLFTRDIERCIKEQPTLSPADVRPMVRGKWKKRMEEKETPYYKSFTPIWSCSECGTEYDSSLCMAINFCPNCGADIREES